MAESRRPRVLLVDDSKTIRSILRKVLAEDFEVVGDCGDGAEGVTLASELRPDLILMDITMPILDGIEATREIHSRFPDIDVVMLSANSNDQSMYAALSAGARDYLVKPLKARELKKVLGRLVQQRRMRPAEAPRESGPSAAGFGLWSFCGPLGGGDGRSTLMLSVANELRAMGRKVVVFDADPLFGDLSFYLRPGDPELGFEDILKHEVSDPEQLRRGLSPHPSGIHLMGRPARGSACLRGTAERLVKLARNLCQIADHVLVDLPAGLPDALLPVLDESCYVFPVASAQPERLRNLEVLVELLRLCGFQAPRLCPLLTLSAHRLEALGIQEAFPRDDAAVALAMQEAMPVSRVAPRSAYTQRVREFLGSLLQIPVEAPSEPGILGGFFQRLRGK